ncbi:methylated-DNA--[protein]-cysteine S-methyltransferase [Falsiroseomonas sp.]|uniref:methylated-DNA--[protein]-cysteine S-methyltransferase n=1 Tax=Falsiroseomonas sp. TaxID=2870721 RepID=UPI00271F7AD4|nr:methylated-DNA--[protein]-cysteine S-methyltransferase [Falsiroseomonas sp.]MDO9501564.1 methylated-DNA--[protein]-cysteine S-methyltransferase [Falsiroseomonas sp.]
MPQITCLTPLGDITVSAEDDAIVALDWGRGRDQAPTPLLRDAVSQLQDYFDGQRTGFDLPLAPFGSAFQQRVWAALCDIPAGETRSYGDLARLLGSSARAIGQANGSNPIPILIPCHRVVASGGRLGGYSGGDGPATKRMLLDLEQRARSSDPTRPLSPGPQAELPLPQASGTLLR